MACPSLALVAQTVGVWTATGLPGAVLAVCSDSTVADTAVHVSDLRCPVTTDPQQVAAWLEESAGSRMRLVLVTHRSAEVLGRGLKAAGAVADLLVVDEAHRSAGPAGKQSAALHYDQVLPARRRLYMTATPKLTATRTGGGHRGGLSMDDQDTFGPQVFTYPFAQAIRDGWLDDYRVVVIGVTHAEVLRMLNAAHENAALPLANASVRAMVVQAALGKAAVEFGLRRVLVFTSRVHESKRFAATLGRTLARLPARYRPKLQLSTAHVDGTQPVAQRQRALRLLADPPQDGWSVVSNARCLSEGVDVPAVDAVVFTSPRGSDIDIVQAVGRALRRNPQGSGIATVLVPVLLPDDRHDALDQDGEWNRVCQVVRALRAHDSVLGAHLDEQRARAATHNTSHDSHSDGNDSHDSDSDGSDSDGDGGVALSERILIRLPDGYGIRDLLEHITVRVLQDTTDSWWDQFGRLRAFHAQHGHLRVPDRVDSDLCPLWTVARIVDRA